MIFSVCLLFHYPPECVFYSFLSLIPYNQTLANNSSMIPYSRITWDSPLKCQVIKGSPSILRLNSSWVSAISNWTHRRVSSWDPYSLIFAFNHFMLEITVFLNLSYPSYVVNFLISLFSVTTPALSFFWWYPLIFVYVLLCVFCLSVLIYSLYLFLSEAGDLKPMPGGRRAILQSLEAGAHP